MAKDYKDTLNLPETGFPMKASLAHMEPEILGFWESAGIYEKMKDKNRGLRPYVLHDGPPYANGHIHIGHALNKILKDIIVKYKAMRGFYSPYVPGWDCHGLPIEIEVDKKLKGKDVNIHDKRAMCREYAAAFVDVQREEFKRLGVLGDWDKPYLTMTFDYEASIVAELFEFVKKGYVYRGKKPVHWCPSCVTALAEAEVEYADKESPSIYVRFRISGEELMKIGLVGTEAYFIIWTTTPWTLPANLALAVNPDVQYVAVEAGAAVYVIAKDRFDALKSELSLGGVIKDIEGQELLGMKAHHPFIDRESKVIAGDFVTTEDGSGIVHIAPGHGEDDYAAGLREGLDIYAPVDERGKFTASVGVPGLEGQFVFKANALVRDILRGKGALLHEDKITHSYPHCWRCKKPVIFRATVQWFISMNHEDLRQRCLKEIDAVKWVPTWGRDRIYGMVKGRPDWCISRQRSWGVPIALLTCTSCESTLNDEDLFERVIRLFSEQGADVWFKIPADAWTDGRKCPKCGGGEFRKETDILDVWFESGVSHAAVLLSGSYMKIEGGRAPWPADMYLEGSDQHRGWFQSALLAGVGTRDSAPYRTVLTHGFVVDGKGKKMSKSVGNVVSPNDVMKATGAEILRLWVSAEDYKEDIRISNEIVSRLTEAYRKIRNTARFLLANINDFDGRDMSGQLTEIDRWAMSRLQGLIVKVTDAYENFDFHEVYHSLYNFCVVDMSSFYLDILKDKLYTFGKDSPERRAAQWVLNEILHTMTRLMAPVLSFTAEEIWKFIKDKPAESVFLSEFPAVDGRFIDEELELKWQRLIAVRNEVNKALELKRAAKFIGNSLESKVVLYSGKETELMSGYAGFLKTLFIVSQVDIVRDGEGEFKSDSIEGLSVSVERAEGLKCARCWNYSTKVGTFPDEEEVCERCHKVLKGNKT